MASSSYHEPRYSRKKSALSTAQVNLVAESTSGRKSRKIPKDPNIPGVKNGGVSRRRSAPNARHSKGLQTPPPPPPPPPPPTTQRSRSSLGRPVIGINGDGENDNEEENDNELNISSISTITESMDVLEQHDNNHSTTSIDNNHENTNKTIKKQELLNQHFTKLNTGGYYCKLCNGTKNSTKIHKQVPYSDTNLRSHLARQHNLTQVLYPSQRAQYQRKSAVLSADIKNKLDDALIYAVIKDSRAFGDFRKAGFQHFLQVVLPNTNYKGPHRTTVRKRMADIYRAYRKALIEELSSITDIALTADSWSSPRRVHFICITAHYYDQEFGYISKVISFRRFIGRSVALRIRQFIRFELQRLKIDDKICSITTDNGANIKLATNVKEFGLRIPCLAHGIHSIVTKGLGLWPKQKKRSTTAITTVEQEVEEEDGYTDITDEDQTCDDDVESNNSDDNDVSDEETIHNYSSSDYSDSEETCLEDDNKNEEPRADQSSHSKDDENEQVLIPDSKEFILKLLEKTRKLIKTIHRSSKIDKYVRDQIFLKQQDANKRSKEDNTELVLYNELVMDFRIRWSSTFKMLNRFTMLSSILNNVTFTPQHIDGVESQQINTLGKLAFTPDDWSWLSALEFVLERFEQSTRLLSGRTYQTLALGKMIIGGLRHFLSNYKTDQPLINHLKKLLLEKFQEYCVKNLVPEVEEAIVIASFLNPSTYFYLQDDENFTKKAKQVIVLKSKTGKFSPSRSSSSNSTPITQSLSQIIKKPLLAIENFLSNCEALPLKSSTNLMTKLFTVQQEIGYYISSVDIETDFQEYWNKNQHYLPILTRLVRHYCVMPMTSVASESAFSMAGYIQRKQRCSLSATTLRYSMLLRNLEPCHLHSN